MPTLIRIRQVFVQLFQYMRFLGSKRKTWCLTTSCLFFLNPMSAAAASGGTFEWDASPQTAVAGYKLYYGTASRTYFKSHDARTATQLHVPELVAGFTYYFVVTAYSHSGIESLPSNEVIFTAPWPSTLRASYLTPPSTIPANTTGAAKCNPIAKTGNSNFAIELIAVQWPAVTVYASTHLNTWQLLGSIPNPTGRVIITDLESAQHKTRYYKVARVD